MASRPQDLDLRIVLIGKTGVGKSAVGNTILGGKYFRSEPSSESVTASCKDHAKKFGNRIVSVVDTPGVLDTEKPLEIIKKEIVRCVEISCPGPHVFLLVIQVGRFTREEKNSVEALQELFGPRANHYMIVLFTRGGELGDMTIEEYVHKGNKDLKRVVRQCGNRIHVFENQSSDKRQVVELINKIDRMVAENSRSCYTDEMFQEVEAARKMGMSVAQYRFLGPLHQRIIRFHSILRRA